jgi:hypothetical protein
MVRRPEALSKVPTGTRHSSSLSPRGVYGNMTLSSNSDARAQGLRVSLVVVAVGVRQVCCEFAWPPLAVAQERLSLCCIDCWCSSCCMWRLMTILAHQLSSMPGPGSEDVVLMVKDHTQTCTNWARSGIRVVQSHFRACCASIRASVA